MRKMSTMPWEEFKKMMIEDTVWEKYKESLLKDANDMEDTDEKLMFLYGVYDHYNNKLFNEHTKKALSIYHVVNFILKEIEKLVPYAVKTKDNFDIEEIRKSIENNNSAIISGSPKKNIDHKKDIVGVLVLDCLTPPQIERLQVFLQALRNENKGK